MVASSRPHWELQPDERSLAPALARVCHGGDSVLSSHFALFRSVLLETDGAPEVLAALQVFTSCLAEALEKEHKQVHHSMNAAQSLQREGGCCHCGIW